MNVVTMAMAMAMALASASGARAQDADLLLTVDPFRKPELAELPQADVLPEVVAAEPEPEPAEIPELRGILRSPRATLVNLNGELVAVGDRFDRYTVVAVGERNVVLFDGDEQRVISIDDERDSKDGRPVAKRYQ